MSNLAFPPRSLGTGDPWARATEDYIKHLQRQVQQLEQRVTNDGRSLSGLSESVSEQIVELQQQQQVIARVLETLVDTQTQLNLINQITSDDELTEDDPEYPISDPDTD